MLINLEQWRRVHLCVLHNIVDVVPYVELHKQGLTKDHPDKDSDWIKVEHNSTFIDWLSGHIHGKISTNSDSVSERIEQKLREGEEDPVVTRLDTWKHARMNAENQVDDPCSLRILEDVVRITKELEEDELNDIKVEDLLDRAIPLEYSGRVRGCGWGVTKSHMDNFDDDDDAMDSEDDLDASDDDLPKVRITKELEEDELNDIKVEDLLDRAIPLEYSGRVRGCGWGVTKRSLSLAPELSEMAKLKRQCNRLEKDMQEMKTKGFQPMVPSCSSSHMDNFDDDDDAMDSEDDLDASDDDLPKGPITCYLYVEKPRRHVGQGILHNRPKEILHGVPLPEGYARIQFEVAVESERHSTVPQRTDEVRTVGEAVGHFISWPKKLVSLKIECPPPKMNTDKSQKLPIGGNKPTLKTVESTVCAKKLGYPKNGDSPHNSMVLHILRFAPSTILSDIEVPIRAYFDGPHWDECIVHENILEILEDQWLSATSIAFYLRYLGEVYLSENAELVSKFSFLSPHIVPIIGSGTSSNHLAEPLLKHAEKDHILLMPHNVGKHWVLVAINTKTEMIYFMDPAPNSKISQRIDLKNFVESGMKSYRTLRGGKISKTAYNRFNWSNIQCPKQMDDIHCGHYVCCFIKDILAFGGTSIPVYFVHSQPLKFYPPMKMENFRFNWGGYLYNRFLKDKMSS
ncbi:uncharacterized protein A4U43_C08F31040 [Asparagus officinalis]|nr:uncharacterized protein A4U43_C08F31040 [Asparagus officinalis]